MKLYFICNLRFLNHLLMLEINHEIKSQNGLQYTVFVELSNTHEAEEFNNAITELFVAYNELKPFSNSDYTISPDILYRLNQYIGE